MSFISLQFLIFLPIVLLVYWITPTKYRWITLLISSIFFYAYYNVGTLFLIAMVIIISFLCPPVVTGLICLSTLFIFKYLNFTISEFCNFFNLFGLNYSFTDLNIILPLGISFYVFQAISYSIDVSKGKCEKEKNIFKYALYIMFFPQLVAGPIERASDLLPQLKATHSLKDVDFQIGLKYLVQGFFKKIVIADFLGIYVDKIYGNVDASNGLSLILATVFFYFQIYGDFSGYSDIAKGSASLLGIKIMDNFNRPYLASSVRDFWRRWHISLTKWFTDYVYIPLGGNRFGRIKTIRNILFVFLLSGLWHGANFTFIVWGILNGLYLVIELCLNKSKNNKGIFSVIKTFIITCFTWIFFRASTIIDSVCIIKKIFSVWNYSITTFTSQIPILTIFLCLFLCLICMFVDKLILINKNKYAFIIYYVLILTIFFFRAYVITDYGSTSFIYFNF